MRPTNQMKTQNSQAATSNDQTENLGFRVTRLSFFIAGIISVISIIYTLTCHMHGSSSDFLFDPVKLNDPLWYHRLAVGLVEDHHYLHIFWPPGYPVFVALVYSIFGPVPYVVYLVQALMLGFSALVVFNIAFQLTGDYSKSHFTIVLFGSFYYYYYYASALMSETLAILLIGLSFFFLVRLYKRPDTKNALLLGVFLAVATLTKAVVQVFPVLIIVSLIVLHRFSAVKKTAIIILVSFLAIITPWVLRNYIVTHRFVPVATGGPINIWLGNWPEYYEKGWDWDFGTLPEPLLTTSKEKTRPELDRLFVKEAKRNVFSDPARSLNIFMQKFSLFWLGGAGTNPKVFAVYGLPYEALFHVPLFVLAVSGLFLIPSEQKRIMIPIILLVFVYSVVHVMLVVVKNRYNLPILYFEFILASYSLERIGDKFGMGKYLRDSQ